MPYDGSLRPIEFVKTILNSSQHIFSFSTGAQLTSRLEKLAPTIAEICRATGMAGLSLGVMHHGQVIHQANFGYRDIAAQLPPNENTTYVIGSLTKGFTAALTGILVDEGKLDWTTMLREVVTEYHRNENDPALNITIEDLLSHRTGFPGLDGLWLLSDGAIPVTHKDAIAILSNAPISKPLRSGFLYNNFAYEAVGQVIEERSGLKYGDFLQERILAPLGMNYTHYTTPRPDVGNAAKAYACMLNMSHVEIALPLEGQDITMGPAGGIRSSVRDLLIWDKAIMDAARTQLAEESLDNDPYYLQDSPLKQLPAIMNAKINLPQNTYREHSYALGWTRAQLPQDLGVPGTNYVTVGKGAGCSRSRTLLYHEGDIPGFFSFHAILPEEASAVVVLGNSLGLAEPTKLIGALLLEVLLQSSVNTTATLEAAYAGANRGRKLASDVYDTLKSGKNISIPARPLEAYTGRFHHPTTNLHIDITIEQNNLRAAFMGREADTYDLEPYQVDSFFWHLSHDEIVSKGQYIWGSEYYILKFGCPDASRVAKDIKCLKWKYTGYLPGDGDVFRTRYTAE